MKERPILFSAPMVRAILDGSKTQTRRVVKGHALEWLEKFTPDFVADPDNDLCKLGKVGDKLYVRETFSGPHIMEKCDDYHACPPSEWPVETPIWYWADGEPTWGDWTRPRPSIFMPRWASRIDLLIKSVRVERLQDISETDATAEGCTENHNGYFWGGPHAVSGRKQMATASQAYRDLWESINGPDSWEANPWLWAIEFERVKP